jgi:hypothetical protein
MSTETSPLFLGLLAKIKCEKRLHAPFSEYQVLRKFLFLTVPPAASQSQYLKGKGHVDGTVDENTCCEDHTRAT